MNAVSQSPAQQHAPSGTATTAAGAVALEIFLTARGLDLELAAKYGVSACNGHIEIPYRRNGEAVYRKYRGIAEKTFSCDTGHTPFFWNIDALHDETLSGLPLIITEGEFDALAAIQAGFPRAVSVPNGAPPAEGTASLAYLDEIETLLRRMPEIILAVDGDEKGQNLLHDLSNRLGRARCKALQYPKGCKDLNDALRLYGEKGAQETIRRAQWLVTGGRKMSEIPEPPYSRPYDIDIQGFENHLKVRKGDFSVVTGIPSHGKSTFVNDMMCRLTRKHGLRVAFASFEQSPKPDHRRALRSWFAGKFEKHMTGQERDAADAWIEEKFDLITPEPEDAPTLQWLFENMTATVIRSGADIIVIDPWNELTHDRPRDMTLTEYTGEAIRQLKRFAMKNNVHVMVVAHPAKMQRSKDGKYPVPTLYDISDSQHWYNKADLGVIVHRDAEQGDSVIIAKSRYHTEIGRPGVVDVKYSIETGRYIVVDNKVLNGGRR